jgi:hypothetical protein
MLRVDSTTSRLRCLASLAVGLAALGASAPAQAEEQVEKGFALQASLGAKSSLVTTNGGMNGVGTVLPGAGLSTELFLGYKLDRLILGLGLEFSNETVNTSTTVLGTTTSTNTSTSTLLIGPNVDFALVKVADGKVELVGALALHFGHAFIPNVNDGSSNFLLSYQVGPGVRLWAAKNFAITGLTGFGGELFHYIPPPNTNVSADSSDHGIFGTVGLMGVF